MRTLEDIREIFERYGGIMRTSQLVEEKIYYLNIHQLLDDGYIEKVRYGYYRWVDAALESEAGIVAALYPDAVFCMDTALKFYGYLNENVTVWHVAVSKDSGKSRFTLDYPFVKPYYIEPAVLEVGVTTVNIDGVEVKMYDRERVICDCLRYRNRMDAEVFNKAIKGYIEDPNKDISHLNEYSIKLRVSKKARDLIGIWL